MAEQPDLSSVASQSVTVWLGQLQAEDSNAAQQLVLVGWDTAKQELVEATFFSGGGGAVRRYKLQPAGVWVGEAQHFHPDGRAETSKVRIERKNADEYTWTETDRSLGGPSQKLIQVTFSRVKE